MILGMYYLSIEMSFLSTIRLELSRHIVQNLIYEEEIDISAGKEDKKN